MIKKFIIFFYNLLTNTTAVKSIKRFIFLKSGAIPWSLGYHEYKWKAIIDVINADNFQEKIGTNRYGYRIDERIVEIPWLFSNLNLEKLVMLDAGSALNFKPLITNPKLASKQFFISTLAPEGDAFWQNGISYVYEDLRKTCLKDNFFDCIACISTLEHVGLDNTLLYTNDPQKKESDYESYLLFIKVLHSLLKPGGKLFLSIPYGIKKNYGWFQVFDKSGIDSIIDVFHPTTIKETVFIYDKDCWRLSNIDEAKEGICYDINTSNVKAKDYCAFARAVVCMEMEK